MGLRSSEALPRMEENLQWFVVYTRPRWEKKVASLLEQAGISYYCPVTKVEKQWSDRRKVILEPLFRGYVFVQVAEANKWTVKAVDGVLNFVYYLGKPARVQDEEILTIRKFLQEFDDVKIEDSTIGENDAVSIRTGVLMDYKGVIIEVIGNLAKVKIDSMNLSLVATFNKDNLRKAK